MMLTITRENSLKGLLFHVGCNDANAWKVVISNDEHDAQMIVPFGMSDVLLLNVQG
jgi:hypothetical protein